MLLLVYMAIFTLSNSFLTSVNTNGMNLKMYTI